MGLSIRKSTKQKISAKLNKLNLSSILLFVAIPLLLIIQNVCTMFVRNEIKYINKLKLLSRKLTCATLQIIQMKKSFISLNFYLFVCSFQLIHKQFDGLEDIKCSTKHRMFLSLQLRIAC